MENKLPDAIWLQAKDLAYAVKNDVPMRPVNMVAWVHPNAQMDTQYLLATPERLAALSSSEVNKEEDREGRRYFEAVRIEKELPKNGQWHCAHDAYWNFYEEMKYQDGKWYQHGTDGKDVVCNAPTHWLREVSYKEEELRQENEKMRQALLDIQKHCEINHTGMKSMPAPYDKGIAWYIADKALNPQPSKESSNPTGGISGTIEP